MFEGFRGLESLNSLNVFCSSWLEVVSQASFRSKSALDCQKLVFEVRACKNSYQSKMQTTLDHNFGCGAPIGLWARIITYHSDVDHWSGFELPESLISGVRFWCSHTLTWFGQTKMQTKLGHNFGCGASIKLWSRIIIYHGDVDHWSGFELSESRIRWVRFWHCFAGQKNWGFGGVLAVPLGSKSARLDTPRAAIELKFAGSLSLVLKFDKLNAIDRNLRPDGLFWCVFSDESCWWGARQVCECTLLFKLVFGGFKGLESPKSLNIFCSSWVEVAPQRVSAPTRPWIARN